MMRVFAVSDLHGYLPYIPECELLLLGGDYCPTRNPEQEHKFITGPFTDWLKEVPAKYIVSIAGNHDFIFQNEPELARSLPWHYLQDELLELEGVRIYGTPWTPEFYNWAFMLPESKLKDKFCYIPTRLDILLSHGPAYRHLDQNAHGTHCGSYSLLEAIKAVKPDTVVSGHIHEARGILDEDGTRYYNVTYLDERYEPKYNAVAIPLKVED